MQYRLYYNREPDFPQVWSFDEGTAATEVNVSGFKLDGCDVVSRTAMRYQADDPIWREKNPVAWVTVTSRPVAIRNGLAIFRGRP